jgi:acetamidase/formamidase
MAIHRIEPERGMLVGSFSREYEPVLAIDPGDTVVYRTLDAGWGFRPPDEPDRHFKPKTPGRDDGHALCGPIAIRGARPGMALEVEIGDLIPAVTALRGRARGSRTGTAASNWKERALGSDGSWTPAP